MNINVYKSIRPYVDKSILISAVLISRKVDTSIRREKLKMLKMLKMLKSRKPQWGKSQSNTSGVNEMEHKKGLPNKYPLPTQNVGKVENVNHKKVENSTQQRTKMYLS